MREGEILKIRAERFLETARDLYKKEYYDLCAFNIEQAVQLFLKYEIWKILGDFEKTHKISELLDHYKIASGKVKEIDSLKENYKQTIYDLEIAYIESRYLPAQFLKEQIDLMFKFVEDLLNIFKNG
ncbi:MAG: HEPN domain-containing protein [Minisyncoccia bacterium]|jgi:HEPN domain-containing protein